MSSQHSMDDRIADFWEFERDHGWGSVRDEAEKLIRDLEEQLEAARRDVAEWEERSHRFEHRTYDAEEQLEAADEAFREVLDICEGWTRNLHDDEKLTFIKRTVEGALSIPARVSERDTGSRAEEPGEPPHPDSADASRSETPASSPASEPKEDA